MIQMQTIELTGDAAVGIVPNGIGNMMAILKSLPTKVCLGRIKPLVRPGCLQLGPYLSDGAMLAGVLPTSINRREKAKASLARVYLNDRWGDCVFASKAHMFGLWSANDNDSGGEVQATDKEIQDQYFAYTGGRDSGANIADVLQICQTKGFLMGGKLYKIDGFVSVDNTKKDLCKVAQLIFGAGSFGLDLPQEWTSAAIWKPTNTRIVGGHDVCPIDYDDQGIYVSSWGRIYLMTWDAVMSTRWVTEYYAALGPLWYGSDLIAPCGLKADTLKEDLAKIHGGIIPDWNPVPSPPDNPVPPNVLRIKLPVGKGSYEGGAIQLGSNLMPGDYEILLGGDGPPPAVP